MYSTITNTDMGKFKEKYNQELMKIQLRSSDSMMAFSSYGHALYFLLFIPDSKQVHTTMEFGLKYVYKEILSLDTPVYKVTIISSKQKLKKSQQRRQKHSYPGNLLIQTY